MAEFEEQLNAILGNQEAMGQIMALARSLSGGPAAPEPAQGETPETAEAAEGYVPALSSPQTPDLSALLGELDPRMLQMGMKVLREIQTTPDRSTALLNALRPFLREERQARLDKAIQIARVSRMVRAALEVFGGKEGEGRV